MKCDLLANNYSMIYQNFKGNYATNLRYGALLYALSDKSVDIGAISQCKTIIKKNTGVFSQFKDITFFMTTVMLSLVENPEEVFQRTVKIYEDMKNEGFHSSAYLAMSSLFIALKAEPFDYQIIISMTKRFFDAFKKEHRFITSYDDYGFATMLALAGLPVDQTVREAEYCFYKLKEYFSSSNSVQSLTHTLAFGEEDPSIKCDRVIEVYQTLKNKKCKFGKGGELPFLGVIALISDDINRITDEIVEINEYLKTKKGFGSWSISSQERIMLASALVCSGYVEGRKDSKQELTLANSITSIVMAQQMAIIAATSGSIAATTSATI
jgi:hypothetical protein